ncbi:hypothetical protein [Acidocella sp.]|uniref:hypothetical protein n=1 Tax=Acidocella sp. TaxID=50710 RepID=UPI00260CD35A|nr:hypothetical protein [Acidocella sp.]
MKLYFYHLKKCGGTTMNFWLDTLGPAARVYDPSWHFNDSGGGYFAGEEPGEVTRMGRSVFYVADIVHTHAPIRSCAPPGTFCFTMLRDPAARLVSQYTDWQRLGAHDLATLTPPERACVADAAHLSLPAYLRRYAKTIGRGLFDNHLTRALAAGRMGLAAFHLEDAARLLPEALRALHEDYDFVGLTETFDLSRQALCARLALPPQPPAPRLNGSAASAAPPALPDEARDTLLRNDDVLYDAARRLFAQRHLAEAEQYDQARFEAGDVPGCLSRMQGSFDQGAVKFTVSGPVFGSFLHGRDGGFAGPHAVWTQAGQMATLYVPVPAGLPVELLLWVRGYAHETQRAGLAVRVDGAPAAFTADYPPGYAERLIIRHLPIRDFVRLELAVPQAPAPDPQDPRPRGISFDGYGWRACL